MYVSRESAKAKVTVGIKNGKNKSRNRSGSTATIGIDSISKFIFAGWQGVAAKAIANLWPSYF